MSSRRQMTCSTNNAFWKQLLTSKWKSISSITQVIEKMKKDKIKEQTILLQIQDTNPNYHVQQRKIQNLEIRIKRFKNIRNHEFDMISCASHFLARTTC
jgi:hypothetical protein